MSNLASTDPESPSTAPADELMSTETVEDTRDRSQITEYLLSNSKEFRYLQEMRQKGWENEEGDRYFAKRRSAADNADDRTRQVFFHMMLDIAKEMHLATSAFSISPPPGASGSDSQPAVLDLCMAPGGFSASALSRNPSAVLRGMSLPRSKGGHELLIRGWKSDPRIEVKFLDITLLVAEMGMPISTTTSTSTSVPATATIPPSHPDANEFSPLRPFADRKFDLVFCDGQVLRTHPRAPYRERFEARRLTTAQLVLAFQRLRTEGTGTMVVLLHKVENPVVIQLLCTLRRCSASIELFKPTTKHAQRSSFYVIAKGVRPQDPEAVRAVEKWKRRWRVATFGTEAEMVADCGVDSADVPGLLDEFGSELVRLGGPIWKIQADALSRAPFIKGRGGSSKGTS